MVTTQLTIKLKDLLVQLLVQVPSIRKPQQVYLTNTQNLQQWHS